MKNLIVLRASDVPIYLGLIHLNLRVMKYLWICSENLTAQRLKIKTKNLQLDSTLDWLDMQYAEYVKVFDVLQYHLVYLQAFPQAMVSLLSE